MWKSAQQPSCTRITRGAGLKGRCQAPDEPQKFLSSRGWFPRNLSLTVGYTASDVGHLVLRGNRGVTDSVCSDLQLKGNLQVSKMEPPIVLIAVELVWFTEMWPTGGGVDSHPPAPGSGFPRLLYSWAPAPGPVVPVSAAIPTAGSQPHPQPTWLIIRSSFPDLTPGDQPTLLLIVPWRYEEPQRQRRALRAHRSPRTSVSPALALSRQSTQAMLLPSFPLWVSRPLLTPTSAENPLDPRPWLSKARESATRGGLQFSKRGLAVLVP